MLTKPMEMILINNILCNNEAILVFFYLVFKGEVKDMGNFANRCHGCDYFDGNHGSRKPDSIVKCQIGKKGVRIGAGCSEFKPDIGSGCFNCFYHGLEAKNSTVDYHTCSVHKLSHPYIDDRFPGKNGYCDSFAYKDSEVNSSSKEGCFPKGTKILSENNVGICISLLNEGDKVISVDGTNTLKLEKILKINKFKDRLIWELKLRNGKKIRTTQSHSFLTGKGWKKASEISKGSYLVFYEEGKYVQDMVISSLEVGDYEDVYNLIVGKNYTFVADGVVSSSFTYFRVLRKFFWSAYDYLFLSDRVKDELRAEVR